MTTATVPVLLRHELGAVLRDARRRQDRTLRQVSASARVSLGYLSEVERGQKEASSELLASICEALEIPLSELLREVSDRMVSQEQAAQLSFAPASQVSKAPRLPAGPLVSAA